MTQSAASPALAAWEAAYQRFETPAEEIRKFERRLQTFGAREWPRDAAILELFCGRGNGLVALERFGFRRLHGVDLSPRLMASYQGRGTCVVGDCRWLPLQTASQDIAIVQGGLHHLPALPADLDRVLAEVQRVLTPSGLFVVVEPWLTPFLQVVHRIGCSAAGRRVWAKMDALATMIEHERDTYEQWLGRPDEILRLLDARFVADVSRRRRGKLLFAGRPRR